MPESDGWQLEVKEIKGEIIIGAELEVTVDDGTHDLDHVCVRVEEILRNGLIKGKTDFFGSWNDCLVQGQWMTAIQPVY